MKCFLVRHKSLQLNIEKSDECLNVRFWSLFDPRLNRWNIDSIGEDTFQIRMILCDVKAKPKA